MIRGDFIYLIAMESQQSWEIGKGPQKKKHIHSDNLWQYLNFKAVMSQVTL